MHENLFPVGMSDLNVIPVHGHEKFIPQLGADQKIPLCAPVIHHIQRIHIRLGPFCHQAAVIVMHSFHEFQQSFRRVHQIHIQICRSPDKLQLFKRARTAVAEQEFVLLLLTGTVDLISVKGQKFFRDVDISGIAPVLFLHDGMLHLSDDTLLKVGKDTAPFIHVFPQCIGITLRFWGLLQNRVGFRKIPFKIPLQFLHHFRIMIMCPWQSPKLPRHTIHFIPEFQRCQNSFLRCHSVLLSQPLFCPVLLK